MHPFYREFELDKPVSDFFKMQGYTVLKEVKIGFCRADIVAFKDDFVVAVELKLSDRKKAIVQAKNYLLGADFVYLAFPLQKIHNILLKCEQLLVDEGIGLLSVNEKTCRVSSIIAAKPSKRKFASVTLHEVCKRREGKRSKYKIY